MRHKTLIIISAIWTLIWTCFGVWAAEDLAEWSELTIHLKLRLGAFCLFVPLAWLIGLGKLWLLLNHKIR